MGSNNVVVFPKPYSGPKDSVTPEDISRNLDSMKQFHIQETLTNIIPMIFNQLDISGFSFADEDPDGETTLKDGAMIVEALRSFMSKYYDIYHPFQKLSENIFQEDDEEPDSLNIVDELNIKLKEEM